MFELFNNYYGLPDYADEVRLAKEFQTHPGPSSSGRLSLERPGLAQGFLSTSLRSRTSSGLSALKKLLLTGQVGVLVNIVKSQRYIIETACIIISFHSLDVCDTRNGGCSTGLHCRS